MQFVGGLGFDAGLIGGAARFEGNPNQFATRPTDDQIYDFGNGDFTAQAWVNFNQFGGTEQAIFEKFAGGAGPGWTLTYMPGSQSFHFFAGPDIVLNAEANVSPGQWQHVAVRREGTTFSIFQDGSILQQVSALGSIPDTDRPLMVGERKGVQQFPLDA